MSEDKAYCACLTVEYKTKPVGRTGRVQGFWECSACKMKFQKMLPGPVMDLKPIREKIIDLLEDVTGAHKDPQSADFNDCEKDPCAWCEDAKEVLKALADCQPPQDHPRLIGQLPEEVAIERIRAGEDVDAVLEDYGWELIAEKCVNPELLDIAQMPDYNPKVPNGARSVTGGKVFWTDKNKVTCREHGACLCVSPDRKIWRCATCNEGAYLPSPPQTQSPVNPDTGICGKCGEYVAYEDAGHECKPGPCKTCNDFKEIPVPGGDGITGGCMPCPDCQGKERGSDGGA